METEWNRMSDEQRAEFGAWRRMKQEEAEARALAEAKEAAKPKRYEDMTTDEKRAWRQSVGIPVRYGERL